MISESCVLCKNSFFLDASIMNLNNLFSLIAKSNKFYIENKGYLKMMLMNIYKYHPL